MKNIKPKIVLAVVTLALFAFIFQSDISDVFGKNIPGCMDPIALNYNPSATEDDGSCDDGIGLSNELLKKIDSLRVSEWNTDNYFNLRTEIQMEFSSNNQTGSNEETKAQHSLDLAYMYVLKQATEKKVLNCFKSSSILEKEVKKFYKNYRKQSEEIKTAKNWFNKYHQVYSYKKQVKNLLGKRFSKTTFNALNKKINSFSNSREYKKLKKCSALSSIISRCNSDLNKYSKIEDKYITFTIEYNQDGQYRWSQIPSRWTKVFRDYTWYNNQIMILDAALKNP